MFTTTTYYYYYSFFANTFENWDYAQRLAAVWIWLFKLFIPMETFSGSKACCLSQDVSSSVFVRHRHSLSARPLSQRRQGRRLRHPWGRQEFNKEPNLHPGLKVCHILLWFFLVEQSYRSSKTFCKWVNILKISAWIFKDWCQAPSSHGPNVAQSPVRAKTEPHLKPKTQHHSRAKPRIRFLIREHSSSRAGVNTNCSLAHWLPQ